MSVIQTNARGVDVVELEFYTKGTNQAQVTTRDNVVDSTKDYVFGVSELIIPNSSLPLFKPGPPRSCSVFAIEPWAMAQ